MAVTREGEIKEKARQVFEASWDYHFSYEVFASLEFFRKEYKKSLQEKRSQLKASKLQKSLTTVKGQEAEDLAKEIQHLAKQTDLVTRPLSIRVEYDKESLAHEGWVVYDSNNHQFIIQIPDRLKTPWNKDGSSTDEAKEEQLRKTTAHEIGHIALHAVNLMEKGSSRAFDQQMEDEADLFADELCKLRQQRKNGEYGKEAGE